MIKKINDFLAGLPMTIVAGVFLLFDLVPHLMGEFGGTELHFAFFPFDPAWVTIVISGIPLLYLAIWRIIYNPGISKISSALLIGRNGRSSFRVLKRCSCCHSFSCHFCMQPANFLRHHCFCTYI